MLGSIHAWRVILLGYPFTLHGWQFCQVYTAFFQWFFLFFSPLVECCRISTASVSENDFGLPQHFFDEYAMIVCTDTCCKPVDCLVTHSSLQVQIFKKEKIQSKIQTTSIALNLCLHLLNVYQKCWGTAFLSHFSEITENQHINHCKLQEEEVQIYPKKLGDWFGHNHVMLPLNTQAIQDA